MNDLVLRKRFQLKGLVQGIGLRPLVYNLAQNMKLGGWISNSPNGVIIEVEGASIDIEVFPQTLNKSLPGIAEILDWQEKEIIPLGECEFTIRPSLTQDLQSDLFCPDIAFCPKCREEFEDKNNRRYHYPFIGCPVCGPRFTVISELPYDRVRGSMAVYNMCPDCLEEYNNPADRRFHSQLNCCPSCGPQLELWQKDTKVDCDPINEAIKQLQIGNIVAIKGLGSFHLAVDATNNEAVDRLRQRKRRPHKPLALLADSLTKIERFCQIPLQAEVLLKNPASPIVLLPKLKTQAIVEGVAPGNDKLGVMLPYTPLHSLVSEPFLALVLTSGNLSDEPLVKDNDEALEQLSNIADYILLHDRQIQQPCDDSVVNPNLSKTFFLRRSRGFMPKPVKVAHELVPGLACGGELKNTFAVGSGQRVYVSQHLGDLKSPRAYSSYQQAIEHFKGLLRIEPEFVAHDLHPDYLSTQFARDSGLPCYGVQHHHAHIASVMAEHCLEGPVIGVAWDGTGYGDDGNLWGGEFFVADYSDYQRRVSFDYLPLPGGEVAVRQPWRTGLSLLYKSCPDMIDRFNLPESKDVVLRMLENQFNCPLSSSCGRLFDGIAAILGLCNKVTYEGQAAIALQMAAQRTHDTQCYPYEVWGSSRNFVINFNPLVRNCVVEFLGGISVDIIARRFHNTLVAILAEICRLLRLESRLNKVVLSGGVFQNELLLQLVLPKLLAEEFEVYLPEKFPPNDGGLSLGQLLISQFIYKGQSLGKGV